MAWVFVIAAGFLETGFAAMLKLSHGFTRFWPTVAFAACALASFALLNLSLRHLPVGVAYATWTGLGAVGTALIGMIAFSEEVSVIRIGSLVLVVAGIVGLSLTGSGH